MRKLNLILYSLIIGCLFLVVACVPPIAENQPLTQLDKHEVAIDIQYGNLTYDFICDSQISNLSYNITHKNFITSGWRKEETIEKDNISYAITYNIITASPNIDYLVPLSMNISNQTIVCEGLMNPESRIKVGIFDTQSGVVDTLNLDNNIPVLVQCYISDEQEVCGTNGDDIVKELHDVTLIKIIG